MRDGEVSGGEELSSAEVGEGWNELRQWPRLSSRDRTDIERNEPGHESRSPEKRVRVLTTDCLL